jgi:hypothetical protein
VKTRTIGGTSPVYNETLELENDNTTLTVKVKDMNVSCFGGCAPFNTLISSTEIDISRIFNTMETVEGFYSLTSKNQPAGKIYLTITPLSK